MGLPSYALWFWQGHAETERAHVRGTDGYISRSVIMCALLVQGVVMGLGYGLGGVGSEIRVGGVWGALRVSIEPGAGWG
ncbi:MAG: hypothetical protein BGO01_09050 [Armatimonadetes bacterium 55-13]|jgi:hypothetical protein|nr:hypothetical protein [Armatimonadota bacterium]OJU62009.1 MAG: hypothetical protein BGO01_09050 [Armatimonadetes bacterium 55-13]